jgi:hypothetical protein
MVTGTWDGGVTGSTSCTTDPTGTWRVSSPQLPRKTSSATVTLHGMTHATSIYTASANHDGDGGGFGTTITIAKP